MTAFWILAGALAGAVLALVLLAADPAALRAWLAGSDPAKWLNIVFSGIVAAFTIVLARVAKLQWRVTQDMLIETKKAADAAKWSAEAARWLLRQPRRRTASAEKC